MESTQLRNRNERREDALISDKFEIKMGRTLHPTIADISRVIDTYTHE